MRNYKSMMIILGRPRPMIYGYCRSVYFEVNFNQTVSNLDFVAKRVSLMENSKTLSQIWTLQLEGQF